MIDLLTEFIEAVKAAFGRRVRSIVLYGSRASGEQTKRHSDYNLLLVLDAAGYADLHSFAAGGAMRKWVRQGNPPPLIFTPEMLAGSSDVFPVEFLDIRDNHTVLYGDDPFDGMEIDDSNLRHECEYQLRSGLLKLQQEIMASGGKKAGIAGLLVRSLSPVLVVFRHVLRLAGEKPPAKKVEALRALAARTGMDATVFETVLSIRQGDRTARGADPERLMEEYLKQIGKVIDFVDDL